MIDPFEGNWKPCTMRPKDDANILISWKSSDGHYKGPYRGYYLECENKFFNLDDNHGFPVQVDIWIEMPVLPE